jgi:hypothetical protein
LHGSQDTVADAGSPTGEPPLVTIVAVSASCSRPGCQRPPASTLIYDYASSTATIRRLAMPHPMQYDLCELHTERLSVPKGWMLVDERVAAPVVDIRDRYAS